MQRLVERLLITNRPQPSRELEIQPMQGQGRAFCKGLSCVLQHGQRRPRPQKYLQKRKEMFPSANRPSLENH